MFRHVYRGCPKIGTHPRRSCCARATVRTARCGSALCAISPPGPRPTSKACAGYSRAAPSSPPSATRSPLPAACRTGTSPPLSAPPARSVSTASSVPTVAVAATSYLPCSSTGSWNPRPSSPPPVRCLPLPRHPASVMCLASAMSTRTNSTPRWTGCWSASLPSRPRSPSAT